MRAEPKGGYHAPVLAAAIAGLLLFYVLPNPFFAPSDRTPEQAEYAPLPGQTPKVAAANFAQTRTTSSKGIGELPEAFVPNLTQPGLPEFAPRMKECVGDPPRQTEDPMSPPCVPFFEASNGGKTWQGVTRDRIEVVIYVENLDHEIDLSEQWTRSDEADDNGSSDAFRFKYHLARTLKAHYRYFQRRYQTYGREVHIRAIPTNVPKTDQIGQSYEEPPNCDERRWTARETAKTEPFAVAYLGYWNAGCYRLTILEEGIPYFGTNYDVPREEYDEFRPLLWGFFPDQRTSARLTGSFLCRSLKGQRARFSTDRDPLGITTQTRRFAALYPDYTDDGWLFGVEHEQMSRLIAAEAGRQCRLPVSLYKYDADDDFYVVMINMKRDGITTIVSRVNAQEITLIQSYASSIDYYPEWVWENPLAVAWYARTLTDSRQAGFGISPRWHHPAFREQMHYRAYKSMEPDSTPNGIFSADIYYTFHTLFSAIQSAGPHLTPSNMEAGMFTLNLVQPDNPWVPSGGWGPYGPRAVSNYTFVDTGMPWWIDHKGQQPGGAAGEGCFRASLEGRRFFAGEWPTGDDYLYLPEDDCYAGDIEGLDNGP